MANTAVVYRLDDLNKGLQVAGLFGGVLALGQKGSDDVWPQIAKVPVPGNPTSHPLVQGTKPIICQFGRWKSMYPESSVLVPVKEFDFYYEAYDKKPKGYNPDPLMFATLNKLDERMKPSDEIFGIAVDGKAKGYPLAWLKNKGQIIDNLAGKKVTIVWDKQLDTPRVIEPFDGFAMRSYWYAWSAFYPKTTIATIQYKK